MPSHWTWAAARSTGTSHLKAGKGCDDFAACVETPSPFGPVLVAVASDGAGSAPYSAMGSWITARAFTKLAVQVLVGLESLQSITPDTVRDWLDEIRDRIIHAAANKQNAAPRDFAATLVGSIVSPRAAVFIHIGDGASVFRTTDSAEWTVPTWPSQGEYAATTFFVTDDPAPTFQYSFVQHSITDIALFSDGIERLVLDFSKHAAHGPFFDKMFVPLQNTGPGRNRQLSKDLRHFLDGPSVCNKTDDDKTLILAKRQLVL
jgi:hypothetical protein